MLETPQTAMDKLLVFLDWLEAHKIWHRLEKFRDAVMVELAVPGERWEIEFFADGQIDIERFYSHGEVDKIELQDVINLTFSFYHDEEDIENRV